MSGSHKPPALDVDALIDDRRTRIIVCCGSGGVGKTTAAAAIGLRAAERGRQACVLTVDPARRLAQSMGLTSLDNTPRLVAGVGRPGRGPADGDQAGSLHAMMLDMKRTFDEIAGYAEIITLRDIPFQSFCEHHLAPITGFAISDTCRREGWSGSQSWRVSSTRLPAGRRYRNVSRLR